MSHFVKVKYIIDSKIEEDDIHYIPKGKWPSDVSVDRVLVELLINRLKGQYLPFSVVPSILDCGNHVLDVTLKKPHTVNPDDIPEMYIGGIDMRELDMWAYASSLLEQAITLSCHLTDGTVFNIHRNKSLKSKDIEREVDARIRRAMSSIRPEWEYFEIRSGQKPHTYLISSNYPSNLDIASRDIHIITPAVYKIIDKNNAERLFLERSNIRVKHNLDPYPMSPYDESIDKQLFDSFDLTDSEQHKLKEIFNKPYYLAKEKIYNGPTHLSYGHIKVLKTKRVIDLLARPRILPSDVLGMYGRYLSINGGSDAQYTMTAKPYAEIMYEEWDVRYEGYSAPFNNRHSTFSSLYYDVDYLFGSVGPFDGQNIIDFSDHNMSINPPFTEWFYKHTKESIEMAFRSGKVRDDMLIFVKQPNWNEEVSIEWFKNELGDNPYLVGHKIMPNGTYYFERLNGRLLKRLTGGLLFSVLSPLGKNHPKFNQNILDDMAERFTKASPPEIRNLVIDPREYVDKYALKKKVREGIDVKKMVDDGAYLTKMTQCELVAEIEKAKMEIANEKERRITLQVMKNNET